MRQIVEVREMASRCFSRWWSLDARYTSLQHEVRYLVLGSNDFFHRDENSTISFPRFWIPNVPPLTCLCRFGDSTTTVEYGHPEGKLWISVCVVI